jgi:outer membrane receptor protein involved in Fe transport
MRVLSVFFLVLIACATAVRAQPAVIEDVLVTATRIPEESLALPLAWTSLDQAAVSFTGHVHINELMQRVPGAWISRGNGQESLTALRSPVLTGAGSCGAFYMAADNISLRAPGFCNVNQLFDANTEQAGRVEVIRGPATALYGSSAMHGVINILSAPPTATREQRVAVEAGPWDYYRVRYGYGNTLGRHGVSVRANGASDGGYKDDSGYDQQKLTIRHDYQGDRWQTTSALDITNLNQETAGFIEGYKAYEDSRLQDTNPNPEAYRDARSLRLYSTLSRQLDAENLLTVTPYLRANEMEFMMHFVPWKPVEENGHSSLGLRSALYTDSGDWHWVNGIDLDYTDGWLKETQAQPFSPNQPDGVHYDYQVDATAAAAFSQLRLDLGERWELIAGARLEYTRYEYDNRSTDGPACGPDASACRFYRPADRQDEFDNWSLNAGASYAFSPDHIGFLRLARGFRAPETNELYRLQGAQRSADLDSEEISNLEVGVRGSAARTLSYSLSLYAMDKREVIFQDANRFNVSGAKTRHYGAELGLDYRLTPAWGLAVDMTVARHQYDSRTQLLGSSDDIKGNDIDTAPRVYGSARLDWDLSANTSLDARAELEWVYLGSYYLEPDNEHEYGGHSLLNLRLAVPVGDRLRASLRLTNLLGEDYAERADYAFGSYRYFVGQPRAAYVELSYLWQ